MLKQFFFENFVLPFSQLLDYLAVYFDGNYIYSILVVTFVIRLIVLPFSLTYLHNQNKMNLIQPQILELRKKYDTKNTENILKIQMEVQELFKKYRFHPLKSFLPMFVQTPLLLGLYRAITHDNHLLNYKFLFFTLGSKPLFILPLIVFGIVFLQVYLSSKYNTTSSNNKVLLFIAPVISTIFSFFFPSVVSIYIIISTFFGILQTIFYYKFFNIKKKNNV